MRNIKLILILVITAYLNIAQATLQPENELYINLSVSEKTYVTQDILTAQLMYIKDGEDQVVLQNHINTIMANVLNVTKDITAVDTSTENYFVYRASSNNTNAKNQPEKIVWSAGQTMNLKSKDTASVLSLVGKLQNMGLVIQSLNYSLSAEEFEKVQNSLIEKAISKLQAKAEHIAKTLGKKNIFFIEINIDPNSYYANTHLTRMAPMKLSASAEEIVSPIAEPNKAEVTLNINAKALVK